MTKAIVSHLLPLGFTLPQPSRDVVGGYFTWLSLPTPLSAATLTERCVEENVIVAPGSIFEVPEQLRFDGHMRLCWAWEEEGLLEEGVQRIASVARKMLDEGSENGEGYVVVDKQGSLDRFGGTE